jgi:YD repeat-containing protein
MTQFAFLETTSTTNYDGSGNITAQYDPLGEVTTYGYNDLEQQGKQRCQEPKTTVPDTFDLRRSAAASRLAPSSTRPATSSPTPTLKTAR